MQTSVKDQYILDPCCPATAPWAHATDDSVELSEHKDTRHAVFTDQIIKMVSYYGRSLIAIDRLQASAESQ